MQIAEQAYKELEAFDGDRKRAGWLKWKGTAEHPETITVELPVHLRPVLDSIAGETPEQKIANLLIGEIRHNLEACDQERLALEIKYGLEHDEFKRRLETGELGDKFEYTLELDAQTWDDLIAEKRHWLQQLGLLRDSAG